MADEKVETAEINLEEKMAWAVGAAGERGVRMGLIADFQNSQQNQQKTNS